MIRKQDDINNWKRFVLGSMAGMIVLFIVLIVILAGFNNSDWAGVLCSGLSAIGAIVLGTVAIVQNKKAEEANERLAKINQDQLEASIIKDNYPFIKFCDLQRIERNGSVLVLRFFDTRNNPLTEACTRNVIAVPLKGKFENEEVQKEIRIRDGEVREPLQFTFNNDDSQTGFYMIKVPTEELFNGHRYCRIELEMELIGTTGVVTKCKGYALLDSKSNHKGMPGREYPHVYHQFFEIKEIMSKQKFNNIKRERNGD